jgi:hypothetical protein
MRPPVAERIKAWGEAATAVLKALLLTLAIVVVAVVALTTISRDQFTRRVSIEVDPEAEKTLRELGSDVDLRQALVDGLNERVHGAQQIVELRFANLADPNQPDEISFKPFGLDLSTEDIGHILRYVLPFTSPEEVSVKLLCAPLPCTDKGAIRGSLLVTLSGPEGGRRILYPIPFANLGLRRSLHQAMQRSTDLVLEKVQPMIEAIYDSTAPLPALLSDERPQGLERSQGEALNARDTGVDACVLDLVIGVSLFRRGLIDEGIDAEKRAMGAHWLNGNCRVEAATNIAFLLISPALCDPLPKVRKRKNDMAMAREALNQLRNHYLVMTDKTIDYRIPSARLQLDIVDAINKTEDKTRKAICDSARMAPTDVSNGLSKDIRDINNNMLNKLMQPSPSLHYHHPVITLLRKTLEAGVPRTDFLDRFKTASEIMGNIEKYVVTDKHPRWLFLNQGELAMDKAWTIPTS